MGLNKLKPEKGAILLADPALEELYFHRASILITEHDKEGTVGFVLNKEMDISLGQAVEDFKGLDIPVYLGGPVGKENMYYIHTAGRLVPNSIEIKPGLFFGGDYNIIKKLILSGNLKSNEIKFFIGYSGWTPGQLDKEMDKNSWFVSHCKMEYVFSKDSKNLWKKMLTEMGTDFALIANFPEDPSLN